MTAFVHLHVHSEYSLQDGIIRIKDLVGRVADQQGSCVALTDQCNLFAMVKFYQAAEAKGVKPIIGADVWVENAVDKSKPYRLILLCQNEQGFHNLTELVSKSYLEGLSQDRPILKKEWIQTHHLGLIAIANSMESDVAVALLASLPVEKSVEKQGFSSEKQTLVETLIEEWTLYFKDRFYLEVTRTNRAHEEKYLSAAVELSVRKNCPLVATNAVRFLKKADFEAHEARVCIHAGYTLNDSKRPKHYTEEQYLKTPEEMSELFADLPEALKNSVEIAKRCNLELKLGQVFLPNYPVPKGFTLEEYFRKEAQTGLQLRFKDQAVPLDYQQRLETELAVIIKMGFAGYFLIVADFIRWANENGVPVGPGRGSGAGSLVAYALQITGLDPIPYDLLFERFLNPERVSLPDFDIDFCMEGRDRVIDYVTDTYGRESVSQIITYGTMAAKAVVRDVGRVLGMPYGFVDKIAKLIPLELGITLEKALREEETLKKQYQEEEDVKILIDLAKKLEGITRNAGKHAGGVVIAPSQLTDFTPLYCDSEGSVLTQFDKNDVETIGLVKFDFLGLRTLTIIDWAMKMVNEPRQREGSEPLDINRIPLNDKKTFDLLCSCHTTAVFQLESRGMKDLVRRLQPDNFEEIIALVALFRPGPLQSGMVDDFINRKHGRATPEYLHSKLTQVLNPTYGIILYQEQVMQIAQILAGYTLGSADLLRRAMGKKKPEEMAKQRATFIQGATERGVDRQIATHIFDLMEKFAGYGFNKSHSAAYALLTYQTAWLKAHYPAAFMAAALSSDMAHTDKIAIFIEECALLKIHLLPPNINQSYYKFTVNDEGNIQYGLGAIKGVGLAAIENIIEARSRLPFSDLYDFCSRVDLKKVSRRVLEALIRSGTFDSFGKHRAWLMANMEDAISTAEQQAKNRIQGQFDLFGESLSAQDLMRVTSDEIPLWSMQEILQGEKEALGIYLSGHPLDQYTQELNRLAMPIRDLRAERNKKITIAGLIVNIRTLNTRKGDRMAFIAIEDKTARQEVAVFSDLYHAKRELLVKDNLVVVQGEVGQDDYTGGLKMRAQEIIDWQTACMRGARYLRVEVQALSPEFTEKLSPVLKPFVTKEGCPVRLFYHRENVRSVLKLGESWNVKPVDKLIEQLKQLEECTHIEVCY